MKFTKLELLNWDIQADQIILLQPGVNLLTGENGSGKTSILDAIKVVLGGRKIGGDRNVEDYLTAQGAPFAMIRLVADNRPAADSRARPFDRAQPSEADHFTLAVVYQAGEDGYNERWYFCPGDVSPLTRGFDGRSFTRKRDYTDRLDKLGMGRSFRRLLCTPQGQVASLCQSRPEELFDLLFDFIGGKQVLDEWVSLRAAFDKQQRRHDDRQRALRDREAELDRLRDRKRSHDRYRRDVQELHIAKQALPVALSVEAERNVAEIRNEREQTIERRAQQHKEAADLDQQLDTARRRRGELEQQANDLEQGGARLAERHRGMVEERAGHNAELTALDALRSEVGDYPTRDLAALQTALTAAEDALADGRHRLRALAEREATCRQELTRLDKGLLTPPGEVAPFRAVLRKHNVAHQLLMELIEPLHADEQTRGALESYLGDFRFAIAVPDIASFAKAVELARAERFPFYVLAPDVRARQPSSGEHPFLSAVRVQDPKYRGLVTRILRGARWLQGPIDSTLRERGAVLVDRDGYVLDRSGGRFQGTDRYFLGRSALQRRRAQLTDDLQQVAAQTAGQQQQMARLRRAEQEYRGQIAQQERKQLWQAQEPEHRRLSEVVEQLNRALQDLDGTIAGHRDHRARIEEQRRDAHGEVVRLEQELERIQQANARADEALDNLAGKLKSAESLHARAAAAVDAEVNEHASALGQQRSPAFLQSQLESAEGRIAHFSEVEKDPNLPANVVTLEKQVQDVRDELARLADQVEQAKQAAERAHKQYRTATKRVFGHYFALLKDAGSRVGFRLQGTTRPRDDGRFAVDLLVAAGDKSMVPYSSASLSGGQKAALSLLMAMTTLRVHQDDGGPGFFLVDEPFSASDTDKIQELGAFLASTGAQYIVSMPTTEELRRCGAWLQSVLTCTQTRGGRDADGRLRLAPRLKMSHVVHDA